MINWLAKLLLINSQSTTHSSTWACLLLNTAGGKFCFTSTCMKWVPKRICHLGDAFKLPILNCIQDIFIILRWRKPEKKLEMFTLEKLESMHVLHLCNNKPSIFGLLVFWKVKCLSSDLQDHPNKQKCVLCHQTPQNVFLKYKQIIKYSQVKADDSWQTQWADSPEG